ncbi:MAG: KH domain-containing protein [Candidatus Ancillula sp.]|jgi:predicted RNA-binding protein YlqC (UPF0109 family)|nr:KH domain-containing protein [Candidatus Ancillula sp.]
MLADALEHLVRGIVEFPGDVSVASKSTVKGPLLVIRANPEDVGRVIGRRGKTISDLRTVVVALSGGNNVRVDVADKFGR